MKNRLSISIFLLLLASLILTTLFVSGYTIPTQTVGPQGTIGLEEPIGSDVVGVRREAGAKSILGVDWVYVAASALVMGALSFGVAVGYETRKQLLQK